MEEIIDFREIIKKRLKKTSLSVPALARKCECAQQTIYNYLNGDTQINAELLGRILSELKVKVTVNA